MYSVWRNLCLGVARRAMKFAGKPLRDPSLASDLYGPSTSGVYVTETTALNSSAFFAGVRVYAETVALLPIGVYERRGKQFLEVEHPTEELLRNEPNPEMSALNFKETLQGHAITHGNAYVEIERNKSGEAIALWPLAPDCVDVCRDMNNELYYSVRVPGYQKPYDLDAADVIHIPAFGWDGIRGYGIVRLARQSIGLGLAAENYGSEYLEKGVRPDGVLIHPGELGDTARKRIRADWEGMRREHRIAMLEEGMTWQALTHTAEEAQFLQTRQFQIAEIARWLRLPPHLIGDLSRSTNNNIEHQGLEFLLYSLLPWLERWSQSLRRKLLSPAEKARGLTYDFDVSRLLKGDLSSRYAAYSSALTAGWLAVNEVRGMENLQPKDGGDKLRMPANQTPVDKAKPPVDGGAA